MSLKRLLLTLIILALLPADVKAADRPAPDLDRGFPAQAARLWQYVQVYLGREPEPAYLLLKPGSGGFPRTGFWLGESDQRHSDYVEVGGGALTGKFGAVDQIFPHELGHTILQALAGPREQSRSAQMHAVAVKTDQQTAFDEGFAEHFQVMAIDDPQAAPDTRALAMDVTYRHEVQQRLTGYRDALGAAFGVLARTRFRGWYARDEQALRYFAVKENSFARQPAIPDRLLSGSNLYGAYLLEQTLPGDLTDLPKSPARMLATEGVVSTLFCRWVTDDTLKNHYREEAFYQRFGVSAAQVTPLENAYLKLFHVFHVKQPHTAVAFIKGYREVFPDEAGAVDQVVNAVLLGQPLADQPELWLTNPKFRIGYTVFDQFRRQAHSYSFDLNAASLVDLLTIPGVDRSLAADLLQGAPYQSLADLKRVPGMTERVEREIARMAYRAETSQAEGLTSFGLHALTMLGLFGFLGGLFYWVVANTAWWRAGLNAGALTLLTLLPAWYFSGWLDLLLPLAAALLFATPAALWRLRRSRREALRVLLAWAAAALPVLVMPFLRY